MDDKIPYNEIDMECSVGLDDDDELIIKNLSTDSTPDTSEGRNLVSKLGIFADFSDDDMEMGKPIPTEEIVELPSLTVGAGKTASTVEQEILNAKNGVMTPEQISRADLTGINEIDMECSVGEDDDFIPSVSLENSKKLDFGDEEEFRFGKPSLEEDVQPIEEKKPDGTVDANYWKDLTKKYNSANKKGMGTIHGHWCHDPEAEKEMFNHDNTPQGSIVPTSAQLGLAGEGQSGSMSDGGLPSLGESMEPSEATEKFKGLLSFMDYKVIPNEESDGYMLRDEIYHADNYSFKSLNELIDILYKHCHLESYLDPEMKNLIENNRELIQLNQL